MRAISRACLDVGIQIVFLVLDAQAPAIEHHTYPADRSFNCNLRGSYHKPSTALAQTRTLAFLREHLG